MTSDLPTADSEAKKPADSAPGLAPEPLREGVSTNAPVKVDSDERPQPSLLPHDPMTDAPVTETNDTVETKGHWPAYLAAALPILFFFALPPLTKSGLWDPFELNVADLSRRLALNLFGADSLALAATDNSLPHLNDLGRPQLPFTSIALGFKLFGLHVWAGRLPLAVWGVVGVLATYAFVARLIDKRAGLYAAVILTSMPLYFVQARTMLGDIVTMASVAMAFGGLAVAVFDRDERGPTSLGARAPWLVLGIVGLACGFASRGGVLGLGVPLLGVGISWLLTVAGGRRLGSPIGDALGATALALGVLAIGVAFVAMTPDLNGGRLLPIVSMGQAKTSDLNMWVGAALKTPSKYPTFDYYIGHLGPALAPWSAVAPFAVGRLLAPPTGRSTQPELFLRESMGRMALLVGTSVALVAHAFLAQRTELIAFCAPAIIASICAVALRDYERGAHPSVALAVGVGVILGVFHHDFHEIPDKAYQAFAVTATTFPESFKEHALMLWTVTLVSFAAISFLTWVERDSDRTPFDARGYLRVITMLREAWDGFLALFFLAVVAGASIAGVAIAVGSRMHAHWLSSISLQIRDNVVNLWWITAFVPLGAILGMYFACDVWLWAFARSRPWSVSSLLRGFEPFEEVYSTVTDASRPRGERITAALVLAPFMTLALPAALLGVLLTKVGMSAPLAVLLAVPSELAVFLVLGALGDLFRGSRVAFLMLWGAIIGFTLCFFYYPALANQVSPKEIFESYERLHKSGEPLALLGVGGKTSAYYAGGQPASFTDTTAGFNWLVAGGMNPNGPRRFLATKAEDLPKLNELYRERSSPRQNVPVVDGRSSQILLLASALLPGEKSQSTLDKLVLAQPPEPQHRLDVNMEDKLEVLGYDITDQGGRLIDYIAPGRKYRMRTYYRVLAPITTEWEAFIHIDGYHRRHNGDHKPMDGKYPLGLWLRDDLLVDDYEIGLEPNFTPGTYTLYFGLFSGDTRLKIKSGPSDGDNRIDGGPIRVQ